jgi:ABC-type multidrug transport system permease subunit
MPVSILYQPLPKLAGVQNRIGYLFFICINSTFGFVMPIISIFPIQRNIMKRERAAGTYRASSAYIAKAISSVPLIIIGVLILVIPSYWMIGLQPFAEQYFIYAGVILVHALTANALGLAIGAAGLFLKSNFPVPNVAIGNILAPLIIVIFILFGGQLINLSTLTPVLAWIQYISPIAYSNKALAQNEFTGLVFTCDESSSICYDTGEQVLGL